MSASRILVEIAADPPPRLDKTLARDVPEDADLSRSRLVKLIAEGAVMRSGEPLTDAKARVVEGDVIEIMVPASVETRMAAENIPLDVVFEDYDLIVINKSAGMVVHPAPGSPGGTLANALLAHCGETLSGVGGEKRPGIVHRIDKNTSGLLVVAKSDSAHHGLAGQFGKHTAERVYTALVHGVPDAADPRLRGIGGASFEDGNILRIATRLARHKTDRQKQTVLFHGGRHAVTRARVVERFGSPAVAGMLECWLETGRTHQIRVHMAHTGHGLIGDPVYGGRRELAIKAVGETAASAAAAFPRQALHAAKLGFIHPVTGEHLVFEAGIPADMDNLIAILRM